MKLPAPTRLTAAITAVCSAGFLVMAFLAASSHHEPALVTVGFVCALGSGVATIRQAQALHARKLANPEA